MDGPQSRSSGSNVAQGDSSNPENKKYDPKYAKFYQAVRTGNLEATRAILEEDPGAVRARISIDGKLPLHVAAIFGHLEIVKELLQRMSQEDFALSNICQITPLHEAIFGETDVAECIIKKNRELLEIPEHTNLLPVTRAFEIGQIKMVRYLYPLTPPEVLQGTHGATLLNLCCCSGMLDIALDLLDKCPSLAVTPDRHGETFLEAMASMPSAFLSGCQLSFWQRWIYNWIDIPKEQLRTFNRESHETISVDMPETTTSQSEERITTKKKSNNNTMAFFGIKNIYRIKLVHMQALELLRIACQELLALDEEQLAASGAAEAVDQAARKGVTEIFTEVLKVFPDIFWFDPCPIFDAVKFRQARIFNLIHGMSWKSAVANLTDGDDNTLLHTAGLLAPSTELRLHDISGAALQMQRELQWFKEVESIMPSNRKEAQNKEGLTARQFFTKNHKELVKEGEKWMKETASSCSVVAALVATIVFAAAFTVPGGNDQNNGYPIFSKKKGFMVFIISDALSLFSSTTSILMFLGILTSRYAEDDFLKSLPRKLIIGLLTLFVSMASMLIAFCAALFVMLRGKLWIVIPVSFLAPVPVISFGWIQYPLLREMIMSTYGPSIFDGDVEPWLTADLICQY